MKLHTECVHRSLWTHLLDLMAMEALESFSLVGGTALALWLGHRESVDIDLFTCRPFDARALAERMEKSLVYFDDADAEPDPKDRMNVSWETVKTRILGEVRAYRRGGQDGPATGG